MPDPVDTMQPWTIKSVPTATREAVIKAARQEGITVGQWLEKRVSEWLADGSPVRSDLVYDLGRLAEMARALTPPNKDSRAMQLARSLVHARLKALPRLPAPETP